MPSHKRWISLCILLLPLFLYGQQPCNIKLTGKILDGDTNLPIAAATIRFSETDNNLMSDEHGFFSVSGLCAGTYTVFVSRMGFKTKTIQVVLRHSENIEIELEHEGVVLHDVEVVGHKKKLHTTASVHTLDQEAMKETRGAVLAELLMTIPGITMLQTGATLAKPVIQGMHSNRVVLVNNGLKQEGQQWGSEHAPEIDPFVASQIHVIKGAESVRYGAEAIGGVIIVDPPTLPVNPEIHGQINLVGSSNGQTGIAALTLEGGLNTLPNLSWRLQGSLKKGGNIQSADYFLENTGVRESNYSAAAIYRHPFADVDVYYSHFQTEVGIFKGAHIGSIADLKSRIEAGRPAEKGVFSYAIDVPRQDVVHNLLKIKSHKDFRNGATFDLQYGWQQNRRQEYDLRRGGRDAIPAMDLMLNAHTLEAVYSQINKNGLRTTIGVNASNVINNNVPGTFVTPLIPNYDSFGLGLFLIERMRFKQLTIEAGIRYDFKALNAAGYDKDQQWYGGKHQFNNISGSIGAIWDASRGLRLQSNLGLAWRPPTVNELYSNGLHHGSASIEIGNSQLKSEQGLKWVNTLSLTNQKLAVQLDAYAQYIGQYIYLDPTGTFEESLRGAFPIFQYRQTNAIYLGFDVQVSYELMKGLTYTLKSAAIRAKDHTEDRFLPMIPAARLQNDIRWNLSQPKRGWQNPYVGLGLVSVFRQTQYEPDSDFAPPPPTYHLVTAKAGVDTQVAGHMLGIALSADNVFNQLYKEYMNRFRYYSHDKGRNITLRLSYHF